MSHAGRGDGGADRPYAEACSGRCWEGSRTRSFLPPGNPTVTEWREGGEIRVLAAKVTDGVDGGLR